MLETSPTRAAILTEHQQREKHTLKQQYRACWASIAATGGTLRALIRRLVELNTSCDELVEWAVEAGARLKQAQKVVSEEMCALGLRRRQPGGGRHSDPEFLNVKELICEQYGFERGRIILHGAARAADSEAKRRAPKQVQSETLIPDGNKDSVSSPIPNGNSNQLARSLIPDGNKEARETRSARQDRSKELSGRTGQ